MADDGCVRLELEADTSLQPCAHDKVVTSTSPPPIRTSRCPSDAAPFGITPASPAIIHSSLQAAASRGRMAIANAVHQSVATARFVGTEQRNATDLLPCAVVLQALALRHIGGISHEVDHVLVHSNLTPKQLELIASFGVKLREGRIPPVSSYDTEFEAANMLKADVSGLTEYSRVLHLDLDMLPRAPVTEHLRYEYPEDFVTFAGTTSPVSGQLYVVRPNRRLHRLLRHLAASHDFSVQRGWNRNDMQHSGLLTWPDVDAVEPRAQCNATYLRRGSHVPIQRRRRCAALWPYWVERCRRHGLTNWNFMSAASDQGLLWYAYNLSGLSSARAIPARARGDNGRLLPLGLAKWAHLQGTCKPWLVSRETLARSKCLKSGAFFWHGVWGRFEKTHDLTRLCPTLASAYARFVSIAPPQSKKPCFWTEACFQKHKPSWVKD